MSQGFKDGGERQQGVHALFLLFTTLSRIIALSVISCFLEYQWTLLLFLG